MILLLIIKEVVRVQFFFEDGMVEFKFWLSAGMPFLAGKIDTSHHHIVKEMLNSMDNNQHVICIDVADFMNFLKNEESLLISQYTIQSDFYEPWLFELLPNKRLLYLHIEVGMRSDPDDPGSIYYPQLYFVEAMEEFLAIDPDRDPLFSFVINKSVQDRVKVWMLTPKN